MSKKTKLLVSDGTTDGGKMAKAREYGTRIVTPEDASVLIDFVQPAE